MAGLVNEGAQLPGAIGVARPRLDSKPKVTGTMRYAADVPATGLLHARLVLSLYASATIDSIDTTAARAVPGVVAVLTAGDLPIKGDEDMRMFAPLARDRVVFAGQPVAIVVAETEAAAEDGVDAVLVEYTPLEPVLDIERALLPDSPLARPNRQAAEGAGASPHAAVGDAASPHAALGGGTHEVAPAEEVSENVVGKHYHKHGDAEAAFAIADVVVEGRFKTNWVYQAYLEPHNTTVSFDGDEIVVTTSTQGIFYTRSQLAKIYGLNVGRIRVTMPGLGGAFGSKILVTEPLALGAALVVKRPVRLALTRREDMLATNPAPGCVIELKIAANRDGSFQGLKSRIVFDSGAFGEWTIESIAAILIAGPYRWRNMEVRAYGVLTNRFGTGSYRGPGAQQASFALETLIDELAEKLKIDAIQLRLANAANDGDLMVDGSTWPKLGTTEVLQAIADHPLWKNRHSLPEGEGVGVAAGIWPGGKEPASAVCRLDPDGSLVVITGVVDMSGATSGFAHIAAAAFGVDVDKVRIVNTDTATAPQSPLSGGSVITYSSGRAIQRAAEQARDQLLTIAAAQMEIDAGDLEIVAGVVRPKGAPDRGVTVVELAAKLDGFGIETPPVQGHAGTVPPSLAPSTTAHLIHVRVDRETGETKVIDYVMSQDCGRALNPALVEGQMRGGAVQGIGWALLEQMVFDDQGQMLTGSFMDYAVPMAGDVPDIETIVVEVPAPDGPFGAKGIGEANVCGGPAAVFNAIAAAAGVRVREMPATARRVHAAITAAR